MYSAIAATEYNDIFDGSNAFQCWAFRPMLTSIRKAKKNTLATSSITEPPAKRCFQTFSCQNNCGNPIPSPMRAKRIAPINTRIASNAP